MKMKMYTLTLMAAGMALLLSCSKKNDVKKEITIDANNLTTCATGQNCYYLFSEQANINDTTALLRSGDYRVFWSNQTFDGGARLLYIKAPMQGNSFELNKADIAAGKVVFITNCPACYSIPMEPVDGFVKGINTTPNNRADQAKWLLEAKVILQMTEGTVRDTIYIKQYFGANFVID